LPKPLPLLGVDFFGATCLTVMLKASSPSKSS
jgi:hypothetical protein